MRTLVVHRLLNVKFILEKKKKNGTNFLLIVKNKIRVRTKDFSQIKLKIFITFPYYIISIVEHIFLYRPIWMIHTFVPSIKFFSSLLHILLISISYLIFSNNKIYSRYTHFSTKKNKRKTTYIRQNF